MNLYQTLQSLNTEAMAALEPAYLAALTKQLHGQDAVEEWSEFRRLFSRAYILAHLIGRAMAVQGLVNQGAEIEVHNRPLRHEDFVTYAESKRNIVTAPFVDALKQFAARVPMLRRVVDRVSAEAKARAFWISNVESTEAIAKVRDRLKETLKGEGQFIPFTKPSGVVTPWRSPVSMTAFLDDEEAALGLTRARLETVYRTNIMAALNEGHMRQALDPEVVDHVCLLQLHEIRDDRTRGAPGTDNPGHHWQMDGFVERPDHPIWATIMPPNGYQCRAYISPLTWRKAESMGLADYATKQRKQEAIDAYNGERWRIINRGEYPDDGFTGPKNVSFAA